MSGCANCGSNGRIRASWTVSGVRWRRLATSGFRLSSETGGGGRGSGFEGSSSGQPHDVAILPVCRARTSRPSESLLPQSIQQHGCLSWMSTKASVMPETRLRHRRPKYSSGCAITGTRRANARGIPVSKHTRRHDSACYLKLRRFLKSSTWRSELTRPYDGIVSGSCATTNDWSRNRTMFALEHN